MTATWCAGCEPDDGDECICQTAVEAHVRRLLGTVYHDEGVDLWLACPQGRFGNRSPMELIKDGDLEPMLQAVDQIVTGSYA